MQSSPFHLVFFAHFNFLVRVLHFVLIISARARTTYQNPTTHEPITTMDGTKVLIESNDKMSMRMDALEVMMQQFTATVQQVTTSI